GWAAGSYYWWSSHRSDGEKMKRVLALLCLVAAPALAQENRKPHLTLTPASIEFGDAAGNSTFDIGNSGNAPLEIRKVAVAESPGFSATDVGPKTLQPGEHVSVTVSYQPDGKRHQAFGGVQIFSND